MMSNMFILLSLIQLITLCCCQRGEFYGDVNGNIAGQLAMNQSKVLNVGEFLYFNKIFNEIRIHRQGIVGIGQENLNECPFGFSDFFASSANYIAPFWLPYTNGDVRYHMENNDGSGVVDFTRIAAEIGKAFQTSFDVNQIDRAIVITWNIMKNLDNQPRTQIDDNSFQMVLVVLKNKEAFTLFVYRVLNYDLVFNLFKNAANGANCREKAFIGLGDQESSFKFPIAIRFFNSRMQVAIYSNIDNYSLLGRYAFKLSVPKNLQPFPPIMNCIAPNPDASVCGLTTVPGQSPFPSGRKRRFVSGEELKANSNKTKELEELTYKAAKEFCLYRRAGQYEHPVFCDMFMYCGVSHSRADIKRCPSALNYNTVLGVCDWKANMECNFPKDVVIKIPEGFKSPEPQTTVNKNFCLFEGWGTYPDLVSCDHYLSCTNTRTIRQPCPSGLYYKPTAKGTGYCDWPRNVNCKDGVRDV